MNSRLQQFLSAENISQAQLADAIGVAKASVSHILAGRNKPSYDFINGIITRYPRLNIEWLLCGKGKMYKDLENNGFADNSSVAPKKAKLTDEEILEPTFDFDEPSSSAPLSTVSRPETKLETEKAPSERKISRIVVFYDDGTFTEIG